MDWLVYIIRCSDDTLYTGITNDLARRLTLHARKAGARYFRGRVPQRVVYLERGHSRSSASRREAVIKKLDRAGKLRLIESSHNQLAAPDLAGCAQARRVVPPGIRD